MGNLEVEDWFKNGKDYNAGVALFEKLSKNRNLLKLLKKQQSDFNTQKLEYELGKFLYRDKSNVSTKKNQVEIVWLENDKRPSFIESIILFFKKLFNKKWKK